VIGEGMIPKVDSAIAAIESGVEKVQLWTGEFRIPFCSKSSPTPESDGVVL